MTPPTRTPEGRELFARWLGGPEDVETIRSALLEGASYFATVAALERGKATRPALVDAADLERLAGTAEEPNDAC